MPPITTPKGGLIELAAEPAQKAGGHATLTSAGSPGRLTIITPEPPPKRPVPPGRRVLGLLLIWLAGWLGTMPADQWTEFILRVQTLADLSLGAPDTSLPSPAGRWSSLDDEGAAQGSIRGEPGQPATFQEDTGRHAGLAYASTIRWAVVAVAALTALSLLNSLPFACLLTTAFIAGTAYAAYGLVAGESALPWRWLVIGSLLPAYVVHSSAAAPRLTGRGLPGLMLVIAAAIGAAQGWFDWPALAARIGEGPMRLASAYATECTWATVLFLASLGALWSRTRTTHLLITALLLALAYHCVVSGKIVVREFPTLSRAGEALKTQIDDSFRNVALWRWVVVVELSTLAGVLVGKGLGIGGLNLAFAATWMVFGCFFYGELRSISMLGFAGRTLAPYLSTPASTEPTALGNPLGGTMGLPIGQPPSSAAIRPDPRDPNAAERFQAMPPPEVSRSHVPRPTGTTAVDAQRMLIAQRQLTVREVGLPLWIYMTAVLAAIIAVAGLRLLQLGETFRAALGYAMWLALGAGLAWLWMLDPREPAQSWLSWISDWTQSSHKVHVVWLLFLAAAAGAGAWAFRPTARAESWAAATVVCGFLGTAVTLLWLAVLSYFGGFESLPIWTYAVVAVGQSLPAWVMLVQQTLERHRERSRP